MRTHTHITFYCYYYNPAKAVVATAVKAPLAALTATVW